MTLKHIIKSILNSPFILLIRIYQYTLSPFIGRQCRFIPTCSNYSIEAFRKYGPIKGIYLTVKRITRCHPWGGHGYDPVP